MADEKISQLADAGAPQDTDQLVIARTGSSLSLLFSALKAAIPGGVTSVFTRTGSVTAQTGDYTAAQVGALPSTDDLSAIAAANATAVDWSNNSHKITSLANGSAAQDAAAFGQIPTALPPNGSAGGDLTGTYPNPTIGSAKVTVAKLAAAVTLDAIATANATGADVSVNSHKITNLTNGAGAQDAAAFGQIPTALPPNGTAGGDLSGTYPNPKVAKVTETSGPTDLTIGTITDGQFLKRVGSTLVSAGAPAPTGQTKQIPVTLTAPDATGNGYGLLVSTANIREVFPAYVHDVDGSWWGIVRIPQDYSSAGTIILRIGANSTAGQVTSFIVATSVRATAATWDAALTAETVQDLTLQTTAYRPSDLTFTLSTTPAAGSDLLVQIEHNGTRTQDTLAVDSILMQAVFQYSN